MKHLKYQNPLQRELDSIVGTQHDNLESQDPEDYSRIWNFLNSADYSRITEEDAKNSSRVIGSLVDKLSSPIMVDLGCGYSRWMREVAKTFDVPYVGVDKFNIPSRECSTEDVTFVQADMLNFVGSLSSGEYIFCINGIDHYIISQDTDEYMRMLARELSRASKPGSIVLGYYSIIFDYLEEVGYERVKIHDNSHLDMFDDDDYWISEFNKDLTCGWIFRKKE